MLSVVKIISVIPMSASAASPSMTVPGSPVQRSQSLSTTVGLDMILPFSSVLAATLAILLALSLMYSDGAKFLTIFVISFSSVAASRSTLTPTSA